VRHFLIGEVSGIQLYNVARIEISCRAQTRNDIGPTWSGATFASMVLQKARYRRNPAPIARAHRVSKQNPAPA